MGIPFTVDKKIVRGLDYYNRTVFEFVSKNIGSQEPYAAVEGMTALLSRSRQSDAGHRLCPWN